MRIWNEFYHDMNQNIPELKVGDLVNIKEEPELEIHLKNGPWPKKVVKIAPIDLEYTGGAFVYFNEEKLDGVYINCLKKV